MSDTGNGNQGNLPFHFRTIRKVKLRLATLRGRTPHPRWSRVALPSMPRARPPIQIPALFVGASERLSEEHAALYEQLTELMTRIRAFGEPSCRRGELQIRRRFDAFLRRYVREAEHERDVWNCRSAAPSDAARASAMAMLFAQLTQTVDATPNLTAIEQLERLLGPHGNRPHPAPTGLRAQCGMLDDAQV